VKLSRRWFSVLVVALVACGTSSSSSEPPPVDSKPVLVELTNDVIVPTYSALDAAAGALRDAAQALEASPGADTLTRAQDAWRAARKAWRQADAFRFGPVESKNITGGIDFWPANGEKIEAIIAGADAISAESLEVGGANLRGFMALEFLLFDAEGGNAAVLDKLSAERRRLYVASLARHLKGKTEILLRAWDPAGENFAAQVTGAGQGSAAYPTQKAAVDELVNRMIFAAELVAGTKIATPLAKKNGGVVQLDQEETPRSDNSIADIQASMDGVRSIYGGLGKLVRAKNPALDGRVVAGLDEAQSKVASLPRPFRSALSDQPFAVETAWQAVRASKNTMSTEVASVLGTTLKFNDNDGD